MISTSASTATRQRRRVRRALSCVGIDLLVSYVTAGRKVKSKGNDMTPDEIKKLSDTELIVITKLWNPLNPDCELALREICRRQEIKETENKFQMSISVRWARIAGIAAIVGIVVPFLPIQKCSTNDNGTPSKIEQNIQQPTRNIISSSSSNTVLDNSINLKKTSTYAAPSRKRK